MSIYPNHVYARVCVCYSQHCGFNVSDDPPPPPVPPPDVASIVAAYKSKVLALEAGLHSTSGAASFAQPPRSACSSASHHSTADEASGATGHTKLTEQHDDSDGELSDTTADELDCGEDDEDFLERVRITQEERDMVENHLHSLKDNPKLHSLMQKLCWSYRPQIVQGDPLSEDLELALDPGQAMAEVLEEASEGRFSDETLEERLNRTSFAGGYRRRPYRHKKYG